MQQPAAVSAPPALSPGARLLDRYEVIRFIGGGGFGHIYEARDLALGHRRAIKEAFGLDAQAQHQFRLEAEFLLNVYHPNLVRGYSVFEQSGRLYLVMDYVDGETLEDVAIAHIRRYGRALPEAQVLEWIIPICEAAHTLHLQPVPIIHRDIKPANIKLSTSRGVPVLIDLGLAKLFASGESTVRAALAFTPGYAPPEQYRARGETDQRTDVYGLGATLYFLLTGYQPTEAPARLSAQALPLPTALNRELGLRSEAVVLRAMSLDPGQRYPDTLALARDLRATLDSLRARTAAAPPSIAQPATTSGGRAEGPASSTVVCAQCAGECPAAARYCMRCGAPLRSSSAAAWATSGAALPRPPVAPPVRPTPRLAQTGRHPGPARLRPATAWAGERAGPPARTSEHVLMRSRVATRSYGERGGQWMARAGLQGLADALPFSRVGDTIDQMIWRALGLSGTPAEMEAWSSIFAMLAVACAALSLTAAFARLMLVFVMPALVMGHWSLAHREADSPREFHRMALGVVFASYAWLAIWCVSLLSGR